MAEVRNSSVSHLLVDIENFRFVWKFSGFNKIPFIKDHPIVSPSFSLDDKSETLWQLSMAKEMRSKVKPKKDAWIFDKNGGLEKSTEENGKTDKEKSSDTSDTNLSEKAVGFRLMISDFSEGQSWETVKYYVQIKVGKNTFKTEEKVDNGEKNFSTDSYYYIFASDLNGVDLFEEDTVFIEAFIEHKQIDTRPLIPPTMVNKESFMQKLMHLYKSQKYTDVILTAGDCEIAAHKCILAARSYGMEEYLIDDTEFSAQKLNLDLDETVAEALLIFAYCGRIPEDFPIGKCPALFAVAEKYEVEELKTLVRVYFKNNMSSVLCLSCILEEELVPDMFLGLPEEKVKSVREKKCLHKLQA